MKPPKASKCDVCATPHFERNNYFYGKQFTVRDLFQEQSYFNEKRHLINRMVLGWGVVCGLDVRWVKEKREFIVSTGMALDCCGREIIVCEPQPVPFEQYDEQCRCAQEKPEHEGKFVLCLEYDDCNSEPVDLPAVGCDDTERIEFNRVRDGFKLRIRRWEDACPKHPDGHDPHRVCLNRFKHDLHDKKDQAAEVVDHKCQTETIHHHLCHDLKQSCPDCEGCDCVVLGTIDVKAAKPLLNGPKPQVPKGKLKQEEQNYQQHQGEVKPEPVDVYLDACTDRRLVYGNSLLYDLIYCHHGDLPHIVDFNWRQPAGPKRELNWETFVDLMKKGMTVYFDQEMESASLNPQTFILSFLHEDPDSGNVFVKRFPAQRVKSDVIDGCYTAAWLPDPAWFEDEVLGQKSQLRGGVVVEITLRGSRIWDKDRRGLDGAFLADKLPTGNGTQGTDFIDWFTVLPRDDKKSKEKYSDF
jgi:hypothetical protein